jgi:hypothetical protein
LDIVVVPVLVVVVSSGSVVAPGEPGNGVSGGNSVAVELPVGVNVDVVVLRGRTPEEVVVVVDDVNDVPAGAVEWREV